MINYFNDIFDKSSKKLKELQRVYNEFSFTKLLVSIKVTVHNKFVYAHFLCIYKFLYLNMVALNQVIL